MGRRNNSEITIYDLTGVGTQKVAAAPVTLAHALAPGFGAKLTL